MKKKLLMTLLLGISVTSANAQDLPSYIPSNGLVGFWPFTGNANDISSNANNGVASNVVLSTDRFGNSNQAYIFNGTNSAVTIPSSASLQVSAVTISAWININAANSNYWYPVVSKSNTTAPGNFSVVVATDKIIGNLNTSHASMPQSLITKAAWHHIAFTKTATATKFYINGVLVQNTITSTTGAFNSTLPVIIGQDSPGQLEVSYGKIDDVGIWNRELTATEISTLFSVSLGTDSFTSSKSSLYPNPVKNTFSIATTNTIKEVEIFDLLGKKVFTQKNTKENIDISFLNKGIYIAKVTSEEGVMTTKIVKE